MAFLNPLPPFTPCKRGDKGIHVKRVQEWLNLHGVRCAIDGDFGPATEAALVKATSSKVATDAALFMLEAPMHAACADLPMWLETHNALRLAVVRYAEQHLAQHPREVGGQNRGPWVRLYHDEQTDEDAPAWCAWFARYVHLQAAQQLGVPSPLQWSGNCDRLAATNAARLVRGIDVNYQLAPGGDTIAPGDLFLVRGKARPVGGVDYKHTGIVLEVHPEHVVTIEGNTNDDGAREGYEVCRRVRGYGRLDFLSVA